MHILNTHSCLLMSPDGAVIRMKQCKLKNWSALFPSHFSLHDGSIAANYLSFQIPIHSQTHSLAVFLSNLHCITSTMPQDPALDAKFLFNTVQLSPVKSLYSV